MYDWKNCFEPKILDRGLEYYRSDMIARYHADEDEITAFVTGNYDDYEVEIQLEDGQPVEMYCSCPYADDGNYCKHMAAVLYKWDRESKGESVKAGKKVNIEELVSNADERFVKQFLIELMKKDKKLKLRFLSALPVSYESSNLDDYKKSVDDLIKSYTKYGRGLEYDEVDRFVEDMDMYNDKIDELIDRQNYAEAFEFSCYIVKAVSEMEIDDEEYNADIEAIYSDMIGFWKDIVELADKKIKDNILERVFEMADEFHDRNVGYHVEEFIYSTFKEQPYLQKILDYIQYQVDKLKRNNSSYSDYKLTELIIKKLRMMYDGGENFTDIENYCKENWQYIEIRKWLAEQYVLSKEYDLAIDIYEKSMNDVKSSVWTEHDFKEKLKGLYKITGKHEKYHKQLWELVIKDFNISEYRELKKLYSENEWLSEREKIFKEIYERHLPEIYYEEKMYDKLLKIVLKSSVYLLMKYDNVLGNLYPEEVVGMYEKYLNQTAVQTADRKTYQEWVSILKRMKKFTGGESAVEKIKADWQVKYKNRRALMDELKKA